MTEIELKNNTSGIRVFVDDVNVDLSGITKTEMDNFISLLECYVYSNRHKKRGARKLSN